MAIRRNVAANYVSQGIATFMGVAFIPVYIHYLGLEAYGLVGVFVLLQTWLTLLDFGLTPALAREMAKFTSGVHEPGSIRGLLRSVELAVGGVALVAAIAVWAASGWLATHWLNIGSLPVSEVATALGLIGLVVALRLLENVYRSSAIGLQRQVATGVITSITATVRAVGAIAVLAWISPTIVAFFAWQAAVSVASVIAFRIMLVRSLPATDRPAKPSPELLRSIWRFAGGTVLITVLGTLLSQSDKLVLTSTLTLSAFAVYSFAYMVAGAVRLLAQPIDQAVYPRLTQLYHGGDRAGLSDLYHSATQYSVVIIGGLAAFLAIFGSEVLVLWTQDDQLATDAYPLLRILVIGMMLNGLISGPYYLQMAAGWTDLLVKINVAMVIIFVPIVFVLAINLGPMGAAIAWVLVNTAYLASVSWLMHRRLLRGEAWNWYAHDVARPLAAGLATALLLRPLVPTEGWLMPAYLGLTLVVILVVSGLAAHRVRQDVATRLPSAIRLWSKGEPGA